MPKAYNRNLRLILVLVREMELLAQQGDADRNDESCGLLYARIRQCAAELREMVEREIQAHQRKGKWDELTCRETLKYLHSFLDRELSEAEAHEVEGHLARCSNCRRRFDFQKELRRLVQVRAGSERAPEGLESRIRQMLRT